MQLFSVIEHKQYIDARCLTHGMKRKASVLLFFQFFVCLLLTLLFFFRLRGQPFLPCRFSVALRLCALVLAAFRSDTNMIFIRTRIYLWIWEHSRWTVIYNLYIFIDISFSPVNKFTEEKRHSFFFFLLVVNHQRHSVFISLFMIGLFFSYVVLLFLCFRLCFFLFELIAQQGINVTLSFFYSSNWT